MKMRCIVTLTYIAQVFPLRFVGLLTPDEYQGQDYLCVYVSMAAFCDKFSYEVVYRAYIFSVFDACTSSYCI